MLTVTPRVAPVCCKSAVRLLTCITVLQAVCQCVDMCHLHCCEECVNVLTCVIVLQTVCQCVDMCQLHCCDECVNVLTCVTYSVARNVSMC